MLPQHLASKINKLLGKYPIVSITGPRQSGKTTLAGMVRPEYRYVSPENLSTRQFAQSDPQGFLDQCLFQRFIQLLAGRIGQLFNQNSLGIELGLDNSGKTIHTDFFKGLTYFKKHVPDAQLHWVYGGDEFQKRSEVSVLGMEQLEKIVR